MTEPNDPTASVPPQPALGDTLPQTPEEAARFAATFEPPTANHPVSIPGYEILGVLGRGGMGVVYQARHLVLNRETALKIINYDRNTDPQLLARFRAEAQVVAAIQHPNVVRVLEYGECDGRPYMALECLTGGSLAARLAGHARLSAAEAVSITTQIAAGVQAAHELGIIHRDLKPPNILFTDGGVPKVADFGVAKWGDGKLTQPGAVLGTPYYMAPEQAGGNADSVGPQADVWALGVILYECLTGRRPFGGATADEILASIIRAEPPAPSSVEPSVPLGLDAVCLKCLRKPPRERYQTAGELSKALHELAFGLQTVEIRHRRRSLGRWAERLGIALSAAALGALAAVLIHQSVAPPADTGKPDQALQPPANAPDLGPPPKTTLTGDAGAVWAIVFLPNDQLAMGTEDGSLKIWNTKTGVILRTLEPRQDNSVWGAEVSSDGKYLATASDDAGVMIWNLQTLRQAEVTFQNPVTTKAVAFSPVGMFLAVGDRGSTIRIWDWAKQIPIELKGHRGAVRALAYSPDATHLASASSTGAIQIWNLTQINWKNREAPGRAMELAEHRGPANTVAYSPDKTTLASGGWDGTVRVWNAANGTQLHKIAAHEGDVWSVSFGGSGKWVASAGSDGFVKVWDVDTGKEVFSAHTPRVCYVLRFAPDGTTLAAGSADGTIRLWTIAEKPPG